MSISPLTDQTIYFDELNTNKIQTNKINSAVPLPPINISISPITNYIIIQSGPLTLTNVNVVNNYVFNSQWRTVVNNRDYFSFSNLSNSQNKILNGFEVDKLYIIFVNMVTENTTNNVVLENRLLFGGSSVGNQMQGIFQFNNIGTAGQPNNSSYDNMYSPLDNSGMVGLNLYSESGLMGGSTNTYFTIMVQLLS